MDQGHHRKFEVPAPRTKPVTFEIGDQTFRCVPFVTGLSVLQFSAAMGTSNEALQADACLTLFRRAMSHPCGKCDGRGSIPNVNPEETGPDVEHVACEACLGSTYDTDEFMRFHEFVNDPKNNVDLTLLGQVGAYLVEVYGRRPTVRSSGSGSGRPQTGAGSEVGG